METAEPAMETAEPAMNKQSSGKIISKDAEATDIEAQILAAMRSRVTYLRDEADSFTFESVRRLLEEDMGLEKFALDVHKSFVKEHLVKCLADADNDGASENSQETERKDDASPIKEEAKPSEEHEAQKDVSEETIGDDEKPKGSPEMGLLTAEDTSKTVAEDTKVEGNKEALMSDIRRALRKRTSYIKANSEKITMASLRRLLEQDLKVKKNSLDPFKKFINEELDEVLQIPDAPKRSTEPVGKKVKSTPAKKLSREENSESDAEGEKSESDAEGDGDDEEVAVKKTTAQKRKSSKAEMTGKRKRENGKPVSAKKKAKQTGKDSENDSDAEDSENMADKGHSQSSSEKPTKRTKEPATPAYGKRVERLKSVIKSCGMSIPPTIYRKAKQAPEEKREATLIEELEQILAKEGLSSNPSEKEIKDIKKKKDRLKELEGIDTSNIVSNSRRRSTTSFVPPPKPKITDESESEESENGEDNEEDEEEGEEEEGKEAEEGSQSEEESNNEDDSGEESE